MGNEMERNHNSRESVLVAPDLSVENISHDNFFFFFLLNSNFSCGLFKLLFTLKKAREKRRQRENSYHDSLLISIHTARNSNHALSTFSHDDVGVLCWQRACIRT